MFDGLTKRNKKDQPTSSQRDKARQPFVRPYFLDTVNASLSMVLINFCLIIYIIIDARMSDRILTELGTDLRQAIKLMEQYGQRQKLDLHHKTLLEMKVDLLREKVKRLEREDDANNQSN